MLTTDNIRVANMTPWGPAWWRANLDDPAFWRYSVILGLSLGRAGLWALDGADHTVDTLLAGPLVSLPSGVMVGLWLVVAGFIVASPWAPVNLARRLRRWSTNIVAGYSLAIGASGLLVACDLVAWYQAVSHITIAALIIATAGMLSPRSVPRALMPRQTKGGSR